MVWNKFDQHWPCTVLFTDLHTHLLPVWTTFNSLVVSHVTCWRNLNALDVCQRSERWWQLWCCPSMIEILTLTSCVSVSKDYYSLHWPHLVRVTQFILTRLCCQVITLATLKTSGLAPPEASSSNCTVHHMYLTYTITFVLGKYTWDILSCQQPTLECLYHRKDLGGAVSQV